MTFLVIIIILAFIFDYINGFHDAANSIATIVSTKVLTPFQAVLWAAVFNFAEARKFDEIAAALALLNDAPTEMMVRLLEGPRSDLLLIPCRSARLNWPTVETILRNRPMSRPINEKTLALAQQDYRKLSMETAQRTVRFWLLHNKIEKVGA